MLSDAQWAGLEPLVEACRPKSKTPPQDLRRTISAILWRHQNGAKWRAVPADLGPWWRAAQVFIRWARLGVWERLLNLVQERGSRSGWCSSTGPACARTRRRRVPHEGESQPERDGREALGRWVGLIARARWVPFVAGMAPRLA